MRRSMLSAILAALAVLVGTLPAIAAAPQAQTTPTAAVNAFYDWYYALGPGDGIHDYSKTFAATKPLFDPTLFVLIQKGIARGNDPDPGKRVFDFDPFINSQSGSASYKIGTPVTKGGDIIVPVAISPTRGTGTTTVKVDVRKTADGNYVIYDFVYPEFALRSYVQKQLSQ